MTIHDLVGHIDDPEERDAAASALVREIRRRQRSAQEHRDQERAKRAERPPIVRSEKVCPCCQQNRTAEEFGGNTARPDGLQSICRYCR